MTIRAAFKKILNLKNMTQMDLARKMGSDTNSTIAVPLTRNNGMGMGVGKVAHWASLCGYDLVLQPTGEIKDNQIQIDASIPKSIQNDFDKKLNEILNG